MGESTIWKKSGCTGPFEIVDPTTNLRWDSTLETQPQRTLFHSSAWADVLKDTYGHVPFYFLSRSDSTSDCLWPVMEVASPLTGKRGVSLPFSDMCGPLTGASEQACECFNAVCRVGRERGWRYFEFRGESQYLTGASPSTSFYSHTIELDENADVMMCRCESAVRRAIRKAQDYELVSEISQTWDAVREFFKLHCQTRRRHGLPPQPLRFFRNIHRHIIAKGKGFISTVTHNDRPIAAGVFLHSDEMAIYKFGASDERFQHLRANNLMFWNAMRHCSSLKCKSLNLGRTDRTNEGLRRFKRGWGAKEGVLDYFRIDLRTGAFLQASDLGLGWHNCIFRRLPILLSRGVGAALYRHMA